MCCSNARQFCPWKEPSLLNNVSFDARLRGIAMKPDAKNRDYDERPSEDDMARAKLGPRGVPGDPDVDRMTPQRKKKTPTGNRNTPEHTA